MFATADRDLGLRETLRSSEEEEETRHFADLGGIRPLSVICLREKQSLTRKMPAKVPGVTR